MASKLKTSNPSIQEVQKALWSARAKWFNMGLFFGVEHGTLEAIRGHSSNPDECIRDMLGRVKNGSRNLTWENICKCLREPTVDFAALADDLEAKYLEQDIETIQKGDTPARPDQCVEGLVQVIADRFKLLHVSEDSDLATVLKKHGFTFQAGGVFYEFTRSKETITEQKEIILMDKKTNIYYTGQKAREMIGAPGEAVEMPKLERFKVFVQSRGIGHRFVTSGTSVLYEPRFMNPMQSASFESSLKSTSADASHYKVIKVKKGGELIDCIEREGLAYKPGCAFFEFVNKTEDIHERKTVILMDKHTGEMITGPLAHTLIGAPGQNIEKPQLPRWRVFVQSTYSGSRFIKDDTYLLYEDVSSNNDGLTRVDLDRFRILEVKEDIDLRSFVEENHKLQYNARKFFFEFTSREEDIGDDKEVILMNKETRELYTGSKALEMIGAPNNRVKKPNLLKYRVFVQNAGGGARCVKGGTYVLCEVKL